ncbi:MAG: HAD family hydrolase [Acidimicrobiales bacterium]
MTIERVCTASGCVEVTGVGYRPEGQVRWHGEPLAPGPLWDEVQLVVGRGSLANDAATNEVEGEWTISGDPTEAAFLVAEAKLGLTSERLRRFRRVHEVPFSSERKLMTTVDLDRDDERRPLVVTKGAPDVLLDRCSHEWCAGRVVAMSDERRRQIAETVDAMADDALRTLAVAYRHLDHADDLGGMPLEDELVYLGAAGIIDPPRPEAAAAVAAAHDAGIRVVMITGDHPRTAARIAEQLASSRRKPRW